MIIYKAAESGFTRMFSCLLSVKDTKENIIKKFKSINEYAKFKGFEVILDVNPRVFEELEISYKDLTFFKKTKADGLRTAVFVTSQNENTFGPWPVTDGLPTIEMHRSLPIDVQVKHIIAMININDIIISNCYPTYEELNVLGSMRKDMVTFDVIMEENIQEVEKKILFEEIHFNRGDISDNMIRSTQSRVKYKGYKFELFNAPKMIKRGDIVIESSEYGHYAGELQIALTDMKNSGKSNVVGCIRKEELFILDYIKPWQKFSFKPSTK